MKKYFKKFSVMFVMALILALGFCVSAFADDGGVVGTSNLNNTAVNSAKVGDQLKLPEVGWERYDDTNSNIKYDGGKWLIYNKNDVYYKNTDKFTQDQSAYINFRFKGRKLRIISNECNDRVNAFVIIDGVDHVYSSFSTTLPDGMYLVSEIDVEDGIHNVMIYNDSSFVTGTNVMVLDAIDTDGELLPYDESISLDQSSMNLTEGDSQQLTATTTPAAVGVTWTSSDPSQ